ncbi:hypothetical protein, partial [Rhizobium ruizarguesonis]|uniref:hypothetical protein n=1 Tax=Rhizobium ruizarguesonis TaxID=2081791 RepID=UPI001A8D7206
WQISQYDQDIACGQLKSDRNPSKNRTQSSRLRQRSANFSSLLKRVAAFLIQDSVEDGFVIQ